MTTETQSRWIELPLTELALAIVLGFPAIPRQMAETIADLPFPFGPRIKFRFGPGINSTSLYVLEKQFTQNEN
jgi:hypothetical protein